MFPMVGTISIPLNKLFHTTINPKEHNFEFRVGNDGYDLQSTEIIKFSTTNKTKQKYKSL
jgi:hypothetical protein